MIIYLLKTIIILEKLELSDIGGRRMQWGAQFYPIGVAEPDVHFVA
tara:strand:+ start:22 stop:159 length:138 start_codon:yes stop_codon:yes gene_type:complete